MAGSVAQAVQNPPVSPAGRPWRDLGSLPRARMEPALGPCPAASLGDAQSKEPRGRSLRGVCACTSRQGPPNSHSARAGTFPWEERAQQEGPGRRPRGTARVGALAGPRPLGPRRGGLSRVLTRGEGPGRTSPSSAASMRPRSEPTPPRSPALGAADRGVGRHSHQTPLHRLPAPPPSAQLPASQPPRGASGCQSSGRHPSTQEAGKEEREDGGLSQGSRRGRERQQHQRHVVCL